MRQYLTISEYRAISNGIPDTLPDDAINRFLQLASLKVDQLTFGRIRGDLGRLTAYQKDLIQNAVAMQAETLYSVETATGSLDGSGVSGWSVTDISISYGGASAGGRAQWLRDNNISGMALEMLNLSGLTWRGGI